MLPQSAWAKVAYRCPEFSCVLYMFISIWVALTVPTLFCCTLVITQVFQVSTCANMCCENPVLSTIEWSADLQSAVGLER